MKKRKEGTKGVVVVDFTGVEGSNRVPEGDYLAEVVSVEKKIGEESGQPYLEWYFKIVSGPHAGKKVRHTTSLQPQSLWNLRQVLEALGLQIPESAMRIDLKALRGLQCGISVESETYRGRKKSIITDFFSTEELEAEDAEESEDVEDEEDEETAEDEDEGDEDEDEDDEDEGDGGGDDAEDDDEDDDDEDDEEDEKPKPRQKPKPSAKKARKK